MHHCAPHTHTHTNSHKHPCAHGHTCTCTHTHIHTKTRKRGMFWQRTHDAPRGPHPKVIVMMGRRGLSRFPSFLTSSSCLYCASICMMTPLCLLISISLPWCKSSHPIETHRLGWHPMTMCTTHTHPHTHAHTHTHTRTCSRCVEQKTENYKKQKTTQNSPYSCSFLLPFIK